MKQNSIKIFKIRIYFSKKFDDKQMEILMSKGKNKFSPLWLSLACNELRIFGEFTTVTKMIEDLPEDLDGLVSSIIKRIDSEASNNSIREVFRLVLILII